MSYRPEGWKNPYTGNTHNGKATAWDKMYERGADAMHQEDVKWLLSLPKEVIFRIKVAMSEEEWIEFIDEEGI